MKDKFTPNYIESLEDNEVFVFGSNLDGFHLGGAARIAKEYFGAVWGQGEGLQGNSYAIPTMQGGIETIKPYVDRFIKFDIAAFNIPPGFFSVYRSVDNIIFLKGNITLFYIPPAVRVFGKSGIRKNNLTVFDIFCHNNLFFN